MSKVIYIRIFLFFALFSVLYFYIYHTDTYIRNNAEYLLKYDDGISGYLLVSFPTHKAIYLSTKRTGACILDCGSRNLSPLKMIDVETFTVIPNTFYAYDKNNLYYENTSTPANTEFLSVFYGYPEFNANPGNNSYSNLYAKDDNQVFYKGKIVTGASAKDFAPIAIPSTERDIKKIYDSKTIRQLWKSGDNVYYKGEIIDS